MMWRCILLLPLLLLATTAKAAVSDPADMLRDQAQEERARALGRELRCMVCQNQSIEDSDADLARDLRRIVREQVATGRTDREIMGYLHDRYGDFVLLRPPVRLTTLALWAMPVIALGLGATLIMVARRRSGAASILPPLSAAERARLVELEQDAQ